MRPGVKRAATDYVYRTGSNYELDFERAVHFVATGGYKRVALQLPEGLKTDGWAVARTLEKWTGAMCIVSADPCFGACDLVDRDLEPLGVEAVVHIGHTRMPTVPTGMATFFVAAPSTVDVLPVVEKAIPMLTKPVGVLTNAQHAPALPKIQALLGDHGIPSHVGRGDQRLTFSGQVLGCNFTSADEVDGEVESFLFVGSGMFHPLGVAMGSTKPVIAANPFTGEVVDMKAEADKFLRQRYATVGRALDAKRFGILVGTKIGQLRMDEVERTRKMIEGAGREAAVFALANFSPEVIEVNPADAFVCTACPRIAIDDALRYKKPMLTPPELEIVLGLRPWEKYEFDQFYG
jgi:2-(3-amino-3-carboxypropyl)histidine synthase